jgi:type IV pilus assembly protein PilE
MALLYKFLEKSVAERIENKNTKLTAAYRRELHLLFKRKIMKNEKGFTLIELLVVVLIVGIIAAIALPKYQKAVERSRAYTAIQNVKALVQAEESYRLATGEYTTDKNKLDISVPNTKYFNYGISQDVVMHVIAQSTDLLYQIIYFGSWPSYPQYQNRLVCRALKENEKGLKICKDIGRDFATYAYGSSFSVSYLD